MVLYKCAQSCLTVWNPVDCSPPGSSAHGIFQSRILECVVISSFKGSSWRRDWNCICIGRQILYHWTTVSEFSNFILLHVAKFCSNRIQFISLSLYRMQFCINLSVCMCVCVCVWCVVFKIFLRIIWNISLVPWLINA